MVKIIICKKCEGTGGVESYAYDGGRDCTYCEGTGKMIKALLPATSENIAEEHSRTSEHCD